MTSAVEVKEQVNLPLSKCMELVLSGIQYRLFRATITVTIISLAVAFLMVMLSESLISRQVATAVGQKTQSRRLFDKWVSLLSSPITEADLTADLASLTGPGDGRWQQFKAWGRFDRDDQVQKLHDIAAQELLCVNRFFDKLPEGKRRRLVGPAVGTGSFAYLAEGDHLKLFEERLKESDRKLPVSTAEFHSLLEQWKQTRDDRKRIVDGHGKALKDVPALLGNRPPVEALAVADARLQAGLAGLGYRLSDADLAQIRQEATLNIDARKITDLLKVTLVKQLLADRGQLRLTDADTDVLFKEVSSAGGSLWLAKLSASDDFAEPASKLAIAALNFTSGPAPDKNDRRLYADTSAGKARLAQDTDKLVQANAQRIRQVAQECRGRQELADIETTVMQSDGGGFNNRTIWLIIVSFFVCVVGIANAMLMSVTERFREIATMKCLGATDAFIMINFILESIMQGVAGGVIGAILGFLLGTLRAWASYGYLAWQGFPLAGVAAVAAGAMAVGVIISALAAVYPAYVAARLAPMEAMRIE